MSPRNAPSVMPVGNSRSATRHQSPSDTSRNAMARAQIDPHELRAVWVGSESHPYAVKPTSTLVAEAIGAVPNTQAADWEFACKAGTEAMVAAMGFVGSGMAHYAMAVGMDTAQGKPGDALEYTAGAGGAAYIIGPAAEAHHRAARNRDLHRGRILEAERELDRLGHRMVGHTEDAVGEQELHHLRGDLLAVQ